MPSIREIQNTIYDWVSRETIINTPLTGTVEVFSGSPNVVGTGTLFTQELIENNTILINGFLVKVASISNDINLTLQEDYPGASESGLEYFKGIDAILQDQNFPRPINQYISILISPLSGVGMAARSVPDASGTVTITANREFTVFLQCYGTDSMQILSDLRDSVDKQSVISFFCDNEIANIDILLTTDVSQLLDSMFEPRASLDLLFRTASEITEQVTPMEEIQGIGEYRDSDLTRTIQAPPL